MSVFSVIKRGRQAAKEHRAEQARKEKDEEAKPPYKHVPTHAALDAMLGGPAGWREADRARIVEQNRRRSAAMMASGAGVTGFAATPHAGVPRVHSSLSHVSYPSGYATPVVQLPRGYSYSSLPAGWTPAGRDVSYSAIDVGGISAKGKEVERIIDSSRTSRSSSKVSTGRVPFSGQGIPEVADAEPSPVESSVDSASSLDELEMKPVARRSVPASASLSASRTAKPTSDTASIHRLHPIRSRRVSDPSQTVSRNPLGSRTNTLSPDLATVPVLSPLRIGTAVTTPEEFPSPAPSDSTDDAAPTASSSATGAQNVNEDQAAPQAEIGVALSPGEGKEAAASPTPAKGRRMQRKKMTRFKELERIESNTATTTTAPAEAAPPLPRSWSPGEAQTQGHESEDGMASSTGPDESSVGAQPGQTASPTSRQEASNGRKPVKKLRWLSWGNKSTAVAG
ncbi:hypothetical protein VTH06DRAFT_2040 [Thermothelomyces fergusii]